MYRLISEKKQDATGYIYITSTNFIETNAGTCIENYNTENECIHVQKKYMYVQQHLFKHIVRHVLNHVTIHRILVEVTRHQVVDQYRLKIYIIITGKQ